MSVCFDRSSGLVIVGAEISGPTGTAILRLAVDTGATRTLINPAMLTALGYDLASAQERIEITTGSGVEYAVLLEMASIACLDYRVLRFPVVSHTLPPSAGVDGLLGLDYLSNGTLTIDFSCQEIHFLTHDS